MNVKYFIKADEGMTAVEYGLIMALLAVFLLGTFTFLGTQLKTFFLSFSNKISAITPS